MLFFKAETALSMSKSKTEKKTRNNLGMVKKGSIFFLFRFRFFIQKENPLFFF